ncbi:germination protein, Ger(x)C family [Terribacillus aidingensis]|uniref:Germination protein, Ger(X)C family n=1 Tax=Terribacillus aidingensis TaxID=586416 RepID=A0A285NYC6_9BACI|nr:Ger(x)C family spore germination protein [Terribacillus aidingensis]SNZ14492.1 germination protein, Ger(x)C family [Terribacillus aidingensis]
MRKIAIILLICAIVLSGCWDTREFKEVKLGITAAYDLTDDNIYKNTILIPNVQNSASGPGQESVQFLTATGGTPTEARSNIDRRLSSTYSPSQLDVLLIGEKLAKKDIYPYIDAFYRDPRLHLDAVIAVVKGDAEQALKVVPKSEMRPSEYIEGILESKVETTSSLEINMQKIGAEIFENGQDFVAPAMKVGDGGKTVSYEGLALFHESSYTGKDIPYDHTTLFLLMNNIKGKVARITTKLYDGKKPQPTNYVTIHVEDYSSKVKSKPSKEHKVKTDVNLDLTVMIEEYPADDLSLSVLPKLQKDLEKTLTKEAEDIIKSIQEANCDVFGIGRSIYGHYPDHWKKLDWDKDYKDIEIVPHIKVNIRSRGIFR